MNTNNETGRPKIRMYRGSDLIQPGSWFVSGSSDKSICDLPGTVGGGDH